MAQRLSEENVAAEREAPPPLNSAAWDALMINLCTERRKIDHAAAADRAAIKRRRNDLKAKVIAAESTMGAFDLLYDLWLVREAAEESGDDSVLVARVDSTNAAFRILAVGTQVEMAGLDPDRKAAAEADSASKLEAALAAGAEHGASGASLADCYAAWTAEGIRSKSEKRAFEDAFAVASAAAGRESTPSDVTPAATAPQHWRRAPGRRGRMSKEEIAEKAAFEAALVPRMESAPAVPSTAKPEAYQFGWAGHERGETLNVAVYNGSYKWAGAEERAQIVAGWQDREAQHPMAAPGETALERTARLEAEAEALPTLSADEDEARNASIMAEREALAQETECVGAA